MTASGSGGSAGLDFSCPDWSSTLGRTRRHHGGAVGESTLPPKAAAVKSASWASASVTGRLTRHSARCSPVGEQVWGRIKAASGGLCRGDPRLPPPSLCSSCRGSARAAGAPPHWGNSGSTSGTSRRAHLSPLHLTSPLLFSCRATPSCQLQLRCKPSYFPPLQPLLLLLCPSLPLSSPPCEASPAASVQTWSQSADKAAWWSRLVCRPSERALPRGPKVEPRKGCGCRPARRAGEDPPVLDIEAYGLGPVKPMGSPYHCCFSQHLQRETLETSGGRSFGCVR